MHRQNLVEFYQFVSTEHTKFGRNLSIVLKILSRYEFNTDRMMDGQNDRKSKSSIAPLLHSSIINLIIKGFTVFT